jgi:ATP/maltotriose-dependent transcriptional regulator MalT
MLEVYVRRIASTRLRHVRALMAEGRFEEALALADVVLDSDPLPVVADELAMVRASVALVRGDLDAAIASADTVLSQANPVSDHYTEAQVVRLIASMADGSISRGLEPAISLLAGDTRPVGDAAFAAAFTALGSIAWTEGRVEAAVAFLYVAVRRGGRQPIPQIRPRQSLAVVLGAIGRFDDAELMLDDDRLELEVLGEQSWLAALFAWRGRIRLAAGRLTEAADAAAESLDVSNRLRISLFVPLARSTLAQVALLRGDISAAADHVRRCRADTVSPAPFVADLCDWIDAQIVETRDGTAAAATHLSDVYADPAAHTRLLLEEPASPAWLVQVSLAVGERTRAQIITSAARDLASRNPNYSTLEAIAAHTQGLLEQDPAKVALAIRDHRHPRPRALATEDYAMLLTETLPNDARAQLAKSLQLQAEIGAELDVARLRHRLSDEQFGRRSSRFSAAPLDWTSLTPTERRVSEVVAAGLTNREAADRMNVSRHTIDFHLRQIYRKLNVNSRVALTRLVAEHADRQRSAPTPAAALTDDDDSRSS